MEFSSQNIQTNESLTELLYTLQNYYSCVVELKQHEGVLYYVVTCEDDVFLINLGEPIYRLFDKYSGVANSIPIMINPSPEGRHDRQWIVFRNVTNCISYIKTQKNTRETRTLTYITDSNSFREPLDGLHLAMNRWRYEMYRSKPTEVHYIHANIKFDWGIKITEYIRRTKATVKNYLDTSSTWFFFKPQSLLKTLEQNYKDYIMYPRTTDVFSNEAKQGIYFFEPKKEKRRVDVTSKRFQVAQLEPDQYIANSMVPIDALTAVSPDASNEEVKARLRLYKKHGTDTYSLYTFQYLVRSDMKTYIFDKPMKRKILSDAKSYEITVATPPEIVISEVYGTMKWILDGIVRSRKVRKDWSCDYAYQVFQLDIAQKTRNDLPFLYNIQPTLEYVDQRTPEYYEWLSDYQQWYYENGIAPFVN